MIQREFEDLFSDDTGVAFTPENPPTLRVGSHGPAVAELQKALNTSGVAEPALIPDGVFGDKTRDAVLTFQESNGLNPDAVVGPATWNALEPSLALNQTSPESVTSPGSDLGEGPAPLVAPPPFAAPQPASGCPPYTPEERAASKASGGQNLDFGSAVGQLPPLSALVFDFEPGGTEVRGNHNTFLGEIIQRFGLDKPNATVKISVIEGHTDCQGFGAGPEASKGLNASIRKIRALAVAVRLTDLGALPSNIDSTPEAGGERGPGDDATPEGRALNRSVMLQLPPSVPPGIEIPGPPTDTSPGPPLCLDGRVPSKNWELQSVLGGGGNVFGFEGEGILFLLHNTDAKIAHPAFFAATGGGVGTPTFSVDFPSRTPFTTLLPLPICASDFDGPAQVDAAEAHVPLIPVGFELGQIRLLPPTDPSPIDIGGLQFGFGASIGIVVGAFTVAESIDLPS